MDFYFNPCDDPRDESINMSNNINQSEETMEQNEPKLSKSELVEYVIAKKLAKLTPKLNLLKQKTEELRKENEELSFKKGDILFQVISEYVKKNFSQTIKSIEKECGMSHRIVIKEKHSASTSIDRTISYQYQLHRDTFCVLFLSKNSFNKLKKLEGDKNGTYAAESFLRDEILIGNSISLHYNFTCSNDKRVIANQKKYDDNTQMLHKKYNEIAELEKQIKKIQDQRNVILTSVVENQLSLSETGSKLLGVLEDLVEKDFDTFVLPTANKKTLKAK